MEIKEWEEDKGREEESEDVTRGKIKAGEMRKDCME